jgi:hypothetical protein
VQLEQFCYCSFRYAAIHAECIAERISDQNVVADSPGKRPSRLSRNHYIRLHRLARHSLLV